MRAVDNTNSLAQGNLWVPNTRWGLFPGSRRPDETRERKREEREREKEETETETQNWVVV